jgi:hypothetical protein
MKKSLIVFSIFFFLLFDSLFVFAIDKDLELIYPDFPGNVPPPRTVITDIDEYFAYIYYAALAIGGLVALGTLLYGGFRYLTSAGSPVALQDAKEKLLAALFGMIILFGSWITLYVINPRLVILQPPVPRPFFKNLLSGIWLCKENQDKEINETWELIKKFKRKSTEYEATTDRQERNRISRELQKIAFQIEKQMLTISKKCYYVTGSGDIRSSFTKNGNYVTHVYSVPKIEVDEKTGELTYTIYSGAIYEGSGFTKKGKILWRSLTDLTPEGPIGEDVTPLSKPQSILVFILDLKPEEVWQVTIYQEKEFNKGFEEKEVSPGTTVNDNDPIKAYQIISKDCVKPPVQVHCEPSLAFKPQSIKISHSNPGYIAILSKKEDYSDPLILRSDESNLMEHTQITDKFCYGDCLYEPGTKHILLVSGTIF